MEYSKKLLPITEVCLNLTEACNFACKYCFTEHHPNFMTLDVAKDTLIWLVENCKIYQKVTGIEKNPSIGFFGGEPTLMWDEIIVPLVEYAEKNNIKCDWGITSNCSLLNKEKIDFLAEHNIPILLSMDGDRKTQNLNRPCKDKNLNSFDMVAKNIPYILEKFPYTTFRGTITAETASELFNNMIYAYNAGFNNCFFIINEFEEWNEKSRHIIENEIAKYCLYFIDCFRVGRPFLRWRPFEQAINKIIAINQTVIDFPKDYEFSRIGLEECQKCGLGSGYGSINYKGDIFACQEVASRNGEKDIFCIGNIYQGGINEQKLNFLRNSYFNRPIDKYNDVDSSKCETCPTKLICIGNVCQVNNYILHKDFSATPDCWCWWSNTLLKAAQYVIQILGNNNNQLFKNYLEMELTGQGGPLEYGS